MEPEKKDPEKEPQKVANEPSVKGRTPLVKVEEAPVEEGTPVEPEAGPGEDGLTHAGTGHGMAVLCPYSSSPVLFYLPSS